MGLTAASVLVSGAGSGIGYATTERFRELEARVAALDRADPPGPDGSFGVRADLTDDAEVQGAVAAAASEHGGLDVLVCCAGIDQVSAVEETSDADWLRLYDVNVVGSIRLLRAALPHLRNSSRACVILTASALASVGVPDRAGYTATKGAIVAMARALAAELAPEGIRVMSVSPGTVDTPLLQVVANARADDQGDLPALLQESAARQPLGRVGTPAEVARTIAFLADPDSGLHTGSDLHLDGGMTGIVRAAR